MINNSARQKGYRPKAIWLALGGLFLLVCLGVGWWIGHSEGEGIPSTQDAREQVNNIAHPRSAPLFELKGSDGKTHRLEDLRGNAVIVHFWASWCPPCLAEIPQWLDFAEHWKGQPVKFVAISLDKGWEDALKILPDSKLPENVISVLDTSLKLPDLFGTYQYPETYLLSRDLKIVSKWVGPQEWNNPEIAEAIRHQEKSP